VEEQVRSRSLFHVVWALTLLGIGLMLAQTLEANGAIVYILGRRQEVLDQAASTAVCTLSQIQNEYDDANIPIRSTAIFLLSRRM
jgi:short-subunit dehydrogenase involved in D-alanine esterification of teichoic acids